MSETALIDPVDVQTGDSSKYTQQQKLEACALYTIHGKVTHVAKQLNIPRTTIDNWRKEDWWESHTVAIRQQTKDYTLSRIEKTIESAFNRADEALELGDVVKVDWDENGSERLIRAPVKGKDAATIAAIMIDKRQILMNQPTSIRADASNSMQALAEQFAKLAAKHEEKVVSDQ